MKKYRCENSLKEHTCHGPLFFVKHNNKRKVYCFNSIKNLIKRGYEIDIIKNVPRTDILKNGYRTKFFPFIIHNN